MITVWKERWQNLSQREKVIVATGGAVVGASLLFLVVVDPLMAKIDKLERQTNRKAKERNELAVLAQEFSIKRVRLQQLEQRLAPSNGGFSLLAFMEEAANTLQIRDRIRSMQPQQPVPREGYQETSVDLQLDGVLFPQLLALLVAIHQAPHDVQVRHLQIKPKYDNPVYLDATLRIVSYAKA